MTETMTAKELYIARKRVTEAVESIGKIGDAESASKISQAIVSIDGRLFDIINDKTEVAQYAFVQCKIPMASVAVVLESLPQFDHIGDMYTAYGLSTLPLFSMKDAKGLVNRAIKKFERTSSPGFSTECKEWISTKACRPKYFLNRCETLDEIVMKLSSGHINPLLASIAVEIGQCLETSEEFGHMFAQQVAKLNSDNEGGKFTKLAMRMSGGNLESSQYSTGYLPESHIRQIARREITREFLAVVWGKVSKDKECYGPR